MAGWGDKRIVTFLKGISPKMIVIAQMAFELAHYDVAVQHINHYAMLSNSLFWYFHLLSMIFTWREDGK